MKLFIRWFPMLFLLGVIFLIFRNWIFFSNLSSGDWNFRYEDSLRIISPFPYSWSELFNNSLGGNRIYVLSIDTYLHATSFVLFGYFHLPWVVIERLVWFWPYLFINVFSSYYLYRKLFPQSNFSILTCSLFLLNSYALLVVGGGQMGVGIAYSLSPLVLGTFIQLINSLEKKKLNYLSTLRCVLLCSLVLSMQILFDLRIAYITNLAVIVYLLLSVFPKLWGFNNNANHIHIFQKVFYVVTPFLISFLAHFFWILPLIIMGKSVSAQLGSEYVTANAVQYLSFATFEQGFSLLHPYWPENIFGKVGFMKPEFLLLAVIAYTSLLFSPFKNSRTRRYILFFAILGLIGSFFAKGANEPFGNIYVWLFQHFPGFMMFRDPTKWYTLIAVSYSVLIPFSIKSIFDLLNNQPKSTFSRVIAFNIKSKVLSLNIQNIFLIGVLLYLLFLIKPALFGELRGTFIPHTIPDEYIKLEGFLSSQPQFFRTFWVPTVGRYGLRSEQYPAVSAQEYFRIYDKGQLLKKLKENGIEKKLQELSVKYLIVPYDSEGEIFLNDRKYDNRQYVKTIKEIEKISWLKRVASFRQIGVFELNDAKTHFFSPQNRDLSFTYRNPTEYIVYVKNAKKNDLIVFSESFDSHWVANIGGNLIQSDPYNKLFNSFRLPKDGSYTFMVYYAPQKFVNIGLVVSIFTIFLVSGGLFILKKHD